MANRRAFGNALTDTSQMLLQHALRLRAQEAESGLVAKRQQELARMTEAARIASREDTQRATTFQSILGDPTGAKAEMLANAGDPEAAKFVPSPEAATARFGSSLNGISERAKLPADLGLETGLAAGPGGAPAAKDPRNIEALMALRNERRGVIDEAAQAGIKDKGVTSRTEAYNQTAGTAQAMHENAPVALGDEVAKQDALTPGLVKRAGAESGARAKATLPYDIELAKTRANVQLLNQQEMEKWKIEHPRATVQETNKAANATAALGVSQEIRSMLSELDKRGALGPLAGRYSEIAAGKVKAEDLFSDPATAKLAADYFSSVKLLSSLAAMTHGGTRGGGSVQMVEQFQKVLSGVGDRSIVEGQLDSLDRLMTHYKQHPSEPTSFAIEGVTPQGAQASQPSLPTTTQPAGAGPAGSPAPPSAAQDKLRRLRGGL